MMDESFTSLLETELMTKTTAKIYSQRMNEKMSVIFKNRVILMQTHHRERTGHVVQVG